MKKFFFLLTFIFQTSLNMAAWDYTGPDDERLPYGRYGRDSQLGRFARRMAVGAVADIIEDVTEPKNQRDLSSGYFKVRVVTPIYGCTNGQEIVLRKYDPQTAEGYVEYYDPNYEYNPTNNSRIVFFADHFESRGPYSWTPKVWKQPPEPETIMPSTWEPLLDHWTRQWWYDGDYQLPFTHLTNLLHAARVERNWTNYYHILRDAVPTPASPRVWQDSYWDIHYLLIHASPTQFDYIMNDPLFPVELQDMRQDRYDGSRRYGEDE